MRGDEDAQAEVWSYIPLEQRVPADHPLRPMRTMVDAVLTELSPDVSRLYSRVGRPSIPPEHLLRALLLQARAFFERVVPTRGNGACCRTSISR